MLGGDIILHTVVVVASQYGRRRLDQPVGEVRTLQSITRLTVFEVVIGDRY